MSDRRSVLLVIGAGTRKDRDSRPYRERLPAGAAREYPPWLLETDEPIRQAPCAAGSGIVSERTAEALVAAAREVAGRHDVIGALCPDEALLPPAARVAADPGPPGASVEAVRACRDEEPGRRPLTEADLPQPRRTTVESADGPRAVAGEYGYPVALKPPGPEASSGVIEAEGPDRADTASAVAVAADHPDVERYPGTVAGELPGGPETGVGGSVADGRHEPYAVARERGGSPPRSVETGHVVGADAPALTDPLIRGLPDIPALTDPLARGLPERTHKALGFGHGMTHAEAKPTSRGPVVESNGRPGGGPIPRPGRPAAGVDLGRAAARVAAGVRPPVPPASADAPHGGPRTVGIRLRDPTGDLAVTGIEPPRPEDHPGLIEAVPLVAVGAEPRRPPAGHVSRSAHPTAEGADTGERSARLGAPGSAVTVHGRPPTGGAPAI
ncbi:MULTISPECIES: ATP-grasp domain-containing protein [Streptomyces]|uniref:ATP-binding protein n=1 Tax=Streptomyces sudanensis TaxID=436397 RepID=A0ABY4TIT9_9ACTN|nr:MULTISPECIES: phosphoribosylglycinamide synthetase [Streptomyces]URN18238.1 ATP-binding protein [Streptomyces sudanensis]